MNSNKSLELKNQILKDLYKKIEIPNKFEILIDKHFLVSCNNIEFLQQIKDIIEKANNLGFKVESYYSPKEDQFIYYFNKKTNEIRNFKVRIEK